MTNFVFGLAFLGVLAGAISADAHAQGAAGIRQLLLAPEGYVANFTCGSSIAGQAEFTFFPSGDRLNVEIAAAAQGLRCTRPVEVTDLGFRMDGCREPNIVATYQPGDPAVRFAGKGPNCAYRFQLKDVATVASFATPADTEAACAKVLGRPCAPISDQVRALKLYDAHNHLQHDQSAETLLQWMNTYGVARMVLVPRLFTPDGLAKDEQALGYVKRYPERFVAFIGGQRDDLAGPRAWHSFPAQGFLAEAAERAAGGQYRGLGEFIIRHYGYNRYVSTTHQNASGEEQIPLNTPLMSRVLELAAQFKLPVLIHAEAEAQVRDEMRELLRRHPQVTVIWAHNCGRGPAESAADFLAAFPNLYCDLAGMAVPYPRTFGWGMFGVDVGGWEYRPGSHATRVQNNDGTLQASMRSLFERFSDRFMIGTDIAHPPQYGRYGDVIIAFRRLLSQLDPETARKIGYDNAARLFDR